MTRHAVVVWVMLAAVSAGCAAHPVSYISTTPRPADDAYSCALRKVNELGYTVTNTSKEAGFIAATKQTSGGVTKFFTGSEYHDQLTISIFDGDSATRRIRATAGRVDRKANLFGEKTEAAEPTKKGIDDANVLLSSCGAGPITKQGDFAFETATNSSM